jgi:hypothetical protein
MLQIMATKYIATLIATATLLSACAVASAPMETDHGTYIISGFAAPARGGTAGAFDVIQADAQKCCGTQGKRAVAVGTAKQDLPQAAVFVNQYGGGGTAHAGSADLEFRCI